VRVSLGKRDPTREVRRTAHGVCLLHWVAWQIGGDKDSLAAFDAMDGNACAVDGTDVADPHSSALPKGERRPSLTDSCARTFLRRHRDEALQERRLGQHEQEHTNKRSRAR
jgi:hypothetical protein